MNIPRQPTTVLTLFDLWNYKLFPQGSILKRVKRLSWVNNEIAMANDGIERHVRLEVVGVSAGSFLNRKAARRRNVLSP